MNYTYDPSGNIVFIEDKDVPVVFFDNQKTDGLSEYTYDAVYRLVQATGRENNAALTFDGKDNWNDAPFIHQVNQGDPAAVRSYTQSYQYDGAGNILQVKQQSSGNNWTRNYTYETNNNRLKTTQVGAQTYSYTYHPQHGFMTAMPHLEEMDWNFQEELVKSVRQKVNPGSGTPETTYYQYDGGGQRIRKITENSAKQGNVPTKKEERIYIGSYETYRTYNANSIDFERESLSLMDGPHRFVMIETVKQNTNNAPDPSEAAGTRLTRYQLHNHIGSAVLELDDTAKVISYEEYHPYGTTAYQANNAAIKAAAKRYRYTGMERDEETGFNYHTARYYLPWIGRWMSCDPKGIKGGLNQYLYAANNPILFLDPSGNKPNVTLVTSTNNPDESLAMAIINGLINVDSQEEFERQIRFRTAHGDKEWYNSWSELERINYAEALDPAQQKEMLNEKWNQFINQKYEDYWNKKAAEWEHATKIMIAASKSAQLFTKITIGIVAAIPLADAYIDYGGVQLAKMIGKGIIGSTVAGMLTSSGGSDGGFGTVASFVGGLVGAGNLNIKVSSGGGVASNTATDTADELANVVKRTLSKAEGGPVVATASSNVADDATLRLNQAEHEDLPTILQERVNISNELSNNNPSVITRYQKVQGIYDHADIKAVGGQIKAIEASLGRKITLDEAKKMITLDVISTKTGLGFPLCSRCAFILEGFNLSSRTAEAVEEQMAKIWKMLYPSNKPL